MSSGGTELLFFLSRDQGGGWVLGGVSNFSLRSYQEDCMIESHSSEHNGWLSKGHLGSHTVGFCMPPLRFGERLDGKLR